MTASLLRHLIASSLLASSMALMGYGVLSLADGVIAQQGRMSQEAFSAQPRGMAGRVSLMAEAR